MFIIWRGWAGAISLLILIAAMAGSVAISSAVGLSPGRSAWWFLGLGAVAAGVATWFLGVWVNRTQPRRQIDSYTAARHRELHSLADQGLFNLGPGHAAPRSLQEAHEQADMLLEVEKQDLSHKLVNRHHLWFIPVQFVGVVEGVLGLLGIVANAAGILAK